jgi:hypothetical protein
MHPDAHLYIHCAEQAARARTYMHTASRSAGARRPAANRLRRLFADRQNRAGTTAGSRSTLANPDPQP